MSPAIRRSFIPFSLASLPVRLSLSPEEEQKQKRKKPTPDPRLLEVGLSSLSIRNNLFIFSPKKFDQAT